LINLTVCSLLFFFFGALAAYSCDCNYPVVAERLKRSDIVLLGKVIDIAPIPEKGQSIDEWGVEALASLNVEKQWKGEKVSRIKVYWMRDILSDCGDLPLVKGEKYLIFIDRKKDRYIVYQDCTWSSFAKDSGEDIKKLNLIK
jgi:hypothetical protein